MNDAVLEWLLEGDPAIRWQTLRDLLDTPGPEVERARSQVARKGWGARLVSHQDPDGTWGGGIYTPKWTSTTYTLLLLRSLGLPQDHPAAQEGCRHLLDDAEWVDGGVSFWKTRRQAEICVNGMVLAIVSYFRYPHPRVRRIVDLLLARQFADGGWNCDERPDAHHSSFNTTISVLEGLAEYQSARSQPDAEVSGAMAGGHEYLAAHRLYLSHRTGEVIDPAWTRFSFPPRWHYDVLRSLDHLQGVAAPHDQRFDKGIELVRRRRGEDGRWLLQNPHRGRVFFELEAVGEPSRWNTLRALRVLRWWEATAPEPEAPEPLERTGRRQ